MSEGSLAQEVLGKEKIKELVSQTNLNNQNANAVGMLVTVERWASLARNVAQDARHKFR